MNYYKSKSIYNDRAYLHPDMALLLVAERRVGAEGMCFVGLAGAQVKDLLIRNAREIDDHTDDLNAYANVLIERADRLLCRRRLQYEQVLELAASLMALHGPFGRTKAMIEPAREHVPFVVIDAANRRAEIARLPAETSLAWLRSELVLAN
jgi:hypothetical protein